MKNRSTRIVIGFLALIVIAGMLLAYAYFIEPNRLVVNQVTLKIKGFDPAFDGFKIVAIADIHGGSNAVTEEKICEVVARANEQNADLIVLLGDYVSQRVYRGPLGDRDLRMPMHTVAENLAGLKAKYGVVAVMGNHDDWYSNGEIANELRAIGYTVLDNEIMTVTDPAGRKLRILGLRDQLKVLNWKWFSDSLKQVIAKDGGSGNIIALEHSPDVLPVITGDLSISPDLKLMLAAHTHGGQVWLPVLGTPIVPSSYGQKYSYGHVKENGVDMFVTSGVGTSILPFRFMMPPEIAVLTITAKSEN